MTGKLSPNFGRSIVEKRGAAVVVSASVKRSIRCARKVSRKRTTWNQMAMGRLDVVVRKVGMSGNIGVQWNVKSRIERRHECFAPMDRTRPGNFTAGNKSLGARCPKLLPVSSVVRVDFTGLLWCQSAVGAVVLALLSSNGADLMRSKRHSTVRMLDVSSTNWSLCTVGKGSFTPLLQRCQ